MDTLVDRAVGILEHEPDRYLRQSDVPARRAREGLRDALDRGAAQEVIDAAVKNGVAIEINNRYKLPSASFIKMAKAARREVHLRHE